MFLSAIVSGGLMLWSLRRRTSPGAIWFALLMFSTFVWALGYFFELNSTSYVVAQFWSKVQYLTVPGAVIIWLVLVLTYTGQEKYITPRNLAIFFLIPALTIVLAWTNDYHQWLWINPRLSADVPFSTVIFEHGWWYWVNTGYIYAVFALSTIILIVSYSRSIALYRRQIMVLLIFSGIVFLSNVVYVFGNITEGYNISPITFSVGGIVVAWGLFRYRIFNVMPIAADLVVDTISDAVIVVDAGNRVLNLNPAAERFWGYKLTDALGLHIEKLTGSWAKLAEFFRTDAPVHGEVPLMVQQEAKTIELQVTPIYGRDGWLNARLVVVRDVTARKKSEQALVEARNQALDALRVRRQLLANVSHELRSPLGTILGFAELLEGGTFGEISPKQRDVAGKIIDSANYLTALVDDLLYQAQIEAGAVAVKAEPFDVRTMIRRVEEKMAVLVDVKGLQFRVDIDDVVPQTLIGDTLRIQQILVNLINNAIKYTAEGTVDLRVYCPDDRHWALAVRDTGLGIPAQAQSYIFDAFRQVDNDKRTNIHGVGLGLSIVKQLVTMMDGTIELDSVEGRGSTFTVTLPLQVTTSVSTGETG